MRRVNIKTFINMAFALIVLYSFVLITNCHKSETKQSLRRDITAESVNSSDPKVMILLWNEFFKHNNYGFEKDGKGIVSENRCQVDNCIVTTNRTLRSIEEYDAIVFHAWKFRRNNIPHKRKPGQYYTYLSMESPSTFKVTNSFDNFFNWTVSYRSDSDFFWPYYTIKHMNGNIISPNTNPHWEQYFRPSSKVQIPTFITKKKKVAWFASNCRPSNSRDLYVRILQKYIDVDIYGKCGSLKCPKNKENACFEMLKNDYFFFIAFENSHCDEYMTEKAYNALLHDAIPVLFSRANYTNFIPPNSYLDANVLDPKQMALEMDRLIKNPDLYAEYFWWKGIFTFHHFFEPNLHPFCEMCKTLKKPNLKPKMNNNLSLWWKTSPYSSAPACIYPKFKDGKLTLS